MLGPHNYVAVAVLVLAACQAHTSAVSPLAGCTVPRIAAEFERMPATQRPADVSPSVSVLPTPVIDDAETIAAGDCIRPLLLAVAETSGDPRLKGSGDWRRFSTQFFRSEHGRYLEVAGNPLAAEYMQSEDGPTLPVGAVVTKRSFQAMQSGVMVPGPQFVIEKMPSGYDERVGDWKFTLISDAGVIVGDTRGRDGDKVEFCVECHKSAWRQRFLFFVPPDYRAKN
ncbi:MAG: hypothetical protein EXQ95_14615 [Alphaproteobacteria bacterium]|nr:hypothetical protein [Alphaproteobacteria bacterium]